MSRLLKFSLVLLLTSAVAGVGLVAALFGTILTGSTSTAIDDRSQPEAACTTPVATGARHVELDTEQMENAARIVQTGRALGVPERGLVIALATAMQESTLRNLDHGDRDSLGLFQQRPSQGWGTPRQVRDPVYAATQFFTRLVEVPRWDQLPAAVAAQAVQRSAFPNAYAKWEPLATALVAGGAANEIDFKPTGTRALECAPLTMHLASGRVEEMLQSALAQEGKPYVFGATGPDAFDCSGLLVYAWRQAGYRLTVRTAAQMHQRSNRVAPGHEQPGDIVFREFNTRVRGPGHILIVIQPGLAIEAPSSGKSVRIRPYDPHAPGQELGRLDSSVLVPVRT